MIEAKEILHPQSSDESIEVQCTSNTSTYWIGYNSEITYVRYGVIKVNDPPIRFNHLTIELFDSKGVWRDRLKEIEETARPGVFFKELEQDDAASQ